LRSSGFLLAGSVGIQTLQVSQRSERVHLRKRATSVRGTAVRRRISFASAATSTTSAASGRVSKHAGSGSQNRVDVDVEVVADLGISPSRAGDDLAIGAVCGGGRVYVAAAASSESSAQQ
jgi:hypothetical protein